MNQSEPSVSSSLQTAHSGYLTVREIRAQIRDCEFTPAVAVAREELRLRGRSLEANTERSETARFSNSDDEHGDHDVSRIPAASSAQELWAQHKYSVMARAQNRRYHLHSTALSDLSGWLVFLSDRA